MRLQLIGPMTGYEDFNYPLFHAAAELLRAQGHSVFNPAETFGGDTTRPRAEYMRASIGALLNADAVVLLPGWKGSAGANLEFQVALELGVRIFGTAPCERPERDGPDD